MGTQRQDELAYEQTGDLYSHLQAQSIELAKLREENRELRRFLQEFEEATPSTQEGRFFRSCAVTLLNKLKQLEGE